MVMRLALGADAFPGAFLDGYARAIDRRELVHEVSREPDPEVLDLTDRFTSKREDGVLLGVGRDDLAVVAGEMGVAEVAGQGDADVEVFDLVRCAVPGDAHHVGFGLAVLVVAQDDGHVPL